MKKIILIVVLILISSCYKFAVDDITRLSPGYFCDEYIPCDTVIYNMNCTVCSDSVMLRLLRKNFITVDTVIFKLSENRNVTIKKDTVNIFQEYYVYSPSQFKNMLLEKNRIDRIGNSFDFSPNMKIRWGIFDEIYNAYIQ